MTPIDELRFQIKQLGRLRAEQTANPPFRAMYLAELANLIAQEVNSLGLDTDAPMPPPAPTTAEVAAAQPNLEEPVDLAPAPKPGGLKGKHDFKLVSAADKGNKKA